MDSSLRSEWQFCLIYIYKTSQFRFIIKDSIMNNKSLALCGVICDTCYAFQRKKNKCVGCNNIGNKPKHCTICSIKTCTEKKGNELLLCSDCTKFPCRRIKDLDKRYRLKYSESPIENLISAQTIGMPKFLEIQSEKWKCNNCGKLLCAHQDTCFYCTNKNQYFKSF